MLEILNMSIEEASYQLTAYERWGFVGVEELKEMLMDNLKFDQTDISTYNEFLYDSNYYDDIIYDDINEMLEGLTPEEIFYKTIYGDVSGSDNYFQFNGYANIKGYQDFEIAELLENNTEFKKWYIDNCVYISENEADEIIKGCNELIKKGY